MSSFLSCARCIINPALSMNFKQQTKCFHVRGRRRSRRRRWRLGEEPLLSFGATFDERFRFVASLEAINSKEMISHVAARKQELLTSC